MVFNVRLSKAAEDDIVGILAESETQFGPIARLRYATLLTAALSDLAADPNRPGVLDRPELGDGVKSYNLRFSRSVARSEDGMVRNPRHLLVFKIIGLDIIGIGRVLYDGMELHRHLPTDF